MTNKEAIEHLRELKTLRIEFPNTLQEQALDLAIKALEDVDRLEEENLSNFVKSQHMISMLVEEIKKLRGEEE